MRKNSQISNVGERLLEERKRLGLTQEQLAEASNRHKQTVLNYENGKRSPDAEYLGSLAGIGMDIGYVVTGRRSGDHYPGREAALLDNYRAADEEGKRMVERLAHSVAEPVSDGYEVKVQERK